MLKIEVTEELRVIKFRDKKTGEPRSFSVQVAYAHIPGEKYPSKIEVEPPKGEAAYAPGMYQLAPESIYVRDGRLAISPRLLTQSAAAARVPRAGQAA